MREKDRRRGCKPASAVLLIRRRSLNTAIQSEVHASMTSFLNGCIAELGGYVTNLLKNVAKVLRMGYNLFDIWIYYKVYVNFL